MQLILPAPWKRQKGLAFLWCQWDLSPLGFQLWNGLVWKGDGMLIPFHPLLWTKIPPTIRCCSKLCPAWTCHLQTSGSHNFSGKSIPGPHHSYREGFLPYIQSKPTPCQWEAIPSCPVTPCPIPKALSSSLGALLGTGRGSKAPQSLLLSGLSHPNSPSLAPVQSCSIQIPLASIRTFCMDIIPSPFSVKGENNSQIVRNQLGNRKSLI